LSDDSATPQTQRNKEIVIAGLVPAISLSLAPLCPLDRDDRNKSGHDGCY
jgi:hypothetical protein